MYVFGLLRCVLFGLPTSSFSNIINLRLMGDSVLLFWSHQCFRGISDLGEIPGVVIPLRFRLNGGACYCSGDFSVISLFRDVNRFGECLGLSGCFSGLGDDWSAPWAFAFIPSQRRPLVFPSPSLILPYIAIPRFLLPLYDPSHPEMSPSTQVSGL